MGFEFEKRPHLMVIDPAMRVAEVDCFNQIVLLSLCPVTYHLPALFGLDSLNVSPSQITGIIILGSASSVHDGHIWQTKFSNWLMPLMKSGIPTLGLCFGHQMIAHLFGGRVDFAFQDRRKLTGFREIELESDPLWGNHSITGRMVVSHRESVVTVPPAMKVVGKSKEVPIEALAHRDLPVWTFQPHPEATPAFLKNQEIALPTGPDPFAFGKQMIEDFLKFVDCRKQPNE